MDNRSSQRRTSAPYVVGIDPAKDAFVAAVWDALEKATIGAPAAFANSLEGYEAFARWLEEQGLSQENVFIAVENTGSYSEALSIWLFEEGYRLSLVDPHALWKAFKEEGKSDEIDSRLVAEYGYRYEDRLRPFTPPKALVKRIRALLTTREQLVRQKTALKNLGASLKSGAVETPSAHETIEETMAHLEEQIKELEAKMKALVAQHPRMQRHVEHLDSAPGVGLLLALNLLVLTKGFTTRLNHRRLAAYLGIAPHPHRSGTSVRKKDRSRGFGPAIARKLLHLAARSIKTYDERFRRYALRKEQEGKPKALILNNISNKLLKILCALIKHDKPYIENYQSVNPRLIHS